MSQIFRNASIYKGKKNFKKKTIEFFRETQSDDFNRKQMQEDYLNGKSMPHFCVWHGFYFAL
jgi:hypothetical protein